MKQYLILLIFKIIIQYIDMKGEDKMYGKITKRYKINETC